MYLCLCKSVKESDIRHLAHGGVSTGAQIVAWFGLDDEEACGTCLLRLDELEEILRREQERGGLAQAVEAGQPLPD